MWANALPVNSRSRRSQNNSTKYIVTCQDRISATSPTTNEWLHIVGTLKPPTQKDIHRVFEGILEKRKKVAIKLGASQSIYKEYRSPEEVFKKESMDSLKYKILTLKHPKVMVNSKNTSKYQKGSVLENVVQEGNFIKVTVLVTDEDLILKILSKELTELICGYNCVVINQKGTSPGGYRKTNVS